MNDRNTTLLNVSGMSCPSCIRHIDGALQQLEGVSKVEVRLRAGKVLVEHDKHKAPVSSLIHALAEAGYEAQAQ